MQSRMIAAQIFETGFIRRVDGDGGVGAANSFDGTR